MTDTMKKALKCVLFMAGLAGILFVLSLVFYPKNNEKEDGIIDVAANAILGEPENTIDVLIIGDSESINSINPLRIWEQQGIASYCCGTSLQLLSYSEYFLHQAFKSQSPKIVVLETNEIFRQVTLDDLLLHQLEMVFPLFSFHSRWKVLSFRDISPNVDFTHMDEEKGYYFSTVIRGADDSEYMKERFTSSRELYMFSLERIGEMPEKIAYYLSHTRELQEMADRGRNAAKTHDTWENRIDEVIMKWIRRDG